MVNLACAISNVGCTATAIIAKALSTGSIACNIDNPPVVIHCVLLRCRRKIAAGRKVEHLSFGITDECLGA